MKNFNQTYLWRPVTPKIQTSGLMKSFKIWNDYTILVICCIHLPPNDINSVWQKI
jgi:hypothetical protein